MSIEKRAIRFIVLLVLGILIGAGTALYGLRAQAHEGHHDHHGHKPLVKTEATIGGAFTLTDHNGNEVTEKSWPGVYRLVFFGFTNCPDICPAEMQRSSLLLDKLGDDAARVQPILITTDPERDTVAAMKAYVETFDPRIAGLTGTEEQIAQAVANYKAYAAKGEKKEDGSYTVNHSSFTYFMSPENELVHIFRSTDTVEEMAKIIAPVLKK